MQATPRAWRLDTDAETEVSPFRLEAPDDAAPLVSCLMVTRGRLFPARWAIECFRRQTYNNRELLVVLDDPASELILFIRSLGDDRIRLLSLAFEGKTLGELRNIAVEHARGEYVCQWDDDDLYAPERIQTQLAALVATGTSACVLRRWMLWWPEAGKLAISGVRRWEGSILALRHAMPPYPEMRRGEDTRMLEALVSRAPVLSLDAPDLYLYVHHGGNAFGKQHFIDIYNFSSKRWVGRRYKQRLEQLAREMPVLEYLDDMPECRDSLPVPTASGEPPLVSIIVRSMGRPELRHALTSLAEQDYPRLEIVVVDATCGGHPPLPDIPLPEGHSLKLVSKGHRLLRPHAANAGLEAVHGTWFGFLDDDDTFEPDHVSELVARASRDALLVYSVTRLMDMDGNVRQPLGLRFNRALMFHGPLFTFPAALMHRRVIELGCRFDPAMEICEDRDFFWQIAAHSDFEFCNLATVNYCPDMGTSGTGQGPNLDVARLARYDELLRAKWFGEGSYHYARSLRFTQRGLAAYRSGRFATAKTWFEHALVEYPDDPNALNGLGYLLTDAGDHENAEVLLRTAVKIHPTAGEYRLNLARLLGRTGRIAEAIQEARRASADASVHQAAQTLLRQLQDVPACTDRGQVATRQASRLGPCPCGSGKRYKHCCGGQAASFDQPDEMEIVVRSALDAFQRGKAWEALSRLEGVPPERLSRGEIALACGQVFRELGQFEHAYACFKRAAVLGESARVRDAMAGTCNQWYRETRRESMRRMLFRQIRLLATSVPGSGDEETLKEVHIIAALNKLGGTESRALGLFRWLSQHVRTRLWSVVPPLRTFADRYPIQLIDHENDRFPESGHLVFVGSYFEYGEWLQLSRPARVTICVNIDDLETLIVRLQQLEDIPVGFQLDFTFPSAMFKAMTGLPGSVDYPPVDTDRFKPSIGAPARRGPFVVGRHSREDRLKFHPNDPEFFRQLVESGCQVKILGGTGFAPVFHQEIAAGEIVLLPESDGEMAEFLNTLDCFVYRVHPHLFETGGTVILEAMSVALPVVVFGDRIGVAEIIQNGQNGFLVSTEAEALDCVERLHRSPSLCASMGRAARATIQALMAGLNADRLEFYCPGLRTNDARLTEDNHRNPQDMNRIEKAFEA